MTTQLFTKSAGGASATAAAAEAAGTSREALAAPMVAQLEKFFGAGGIFETFSDRVKAVETLFDGFKGLDVKKTMEEFDKRQSKLEHFADQMRKSRGGFYISGIEEVKDFSLLRAAMGVKLGGTKAAFEKIKAGREYEVMVQAYAKAGDIYGEHIYGKSTSQSVGDEKLGGAFVPDQLIADVITAIYEDSVFVAFQGIGQQRVSTLDGIVGMTAKIPKMLGGMVAYWIGEEDNFVASQVSTDLLTLQQKKLGVFGVITEEMMRYGAFGFEAAWRQDMVRAFADKIDFTVMYGSGSENMPRGIARTVGIKVYSAKTKTYTTLDATGANLNTLDSNWAGAEMTLDGLDNMQGTLDEDKVRPNASHAYVFNPRLKRRIKQLKLDYAATAAANPGYLIGLPVLPDARLRDLIGDFAATTQVNKDKIPGASVGCPTTSSTTKFGDVFSGNFSEAFLARWAGLEIRDDGGVGVGFQNDTTRVKARFYADFGVRQPRALCVCPDAQTTT